MKVLAGMVIAVIATLATFPVLFATGDHPPHGCVAGGDVAAVLATMRSLESGGDYTARARGSSASGAYQFVDGTWAAYGGYSQAWRAPPAVQDAKAAEHVQAILDAHDGDVAAVPVVWYLGHLPAAGSPEWDRVPAPSAGNALTPREYQRRWLDEYARQVGGSAGDDPAAVGVGACARGAGMMVPLPDGFAYPAPVEVFAAAPVDEPHHDYPAWDWGLRIGTPIYAVRGGRVVAVQHWPHNWWDAGCANNAAGCQACGIGVTIEDDTGTRWTYCHGSAVQVSAGTTVAAGTPILASGNSGRSSGPHLHLQLRTADGRLRCPQPLLRSLRDRGLGAEPNALPHTGCFY